MIAIWAFFFCVSFVRSLHQSTLKVLQHDTLEEIAWQQAPLPSLPGSQFEVDTSANFWVDVFGDLDWMRRVPTNTFYPNTSLKEPWVAVVSALEEHTPTQGLFLNLNWFWSTPGDLAPAVLFEFRQKKDTRTIYDLQFSFQPESRLVIFSIWTCPAEGCAFTGPDGVVGGWNLNSTVATCTSNTVPITAERIMEYGQFWHTNEPEHIRKMRLNWDVNGLGKNQFAESSINLLQLPGLSDDVCTDWNFITFTNPTDSINSLFAQPFSTGFDCSQATIVKTNSLGDRYLEGATFGLFTAFGNNEKGELVSSCTTGSNGTCGFYKKSGKYIISELAAPDGYDLGASDQFWHAQGQKTVFTFEDPLKSTSGLLAHAHMVHLSVKYYQQHPMKHHPAATEEETKEHSLANYEHEGKSEKNAPPDSLANYEHEGKIKNSHPDSLANYEHEGKIKPPHPDALAAYHNTDINEPPSQKQEGNENTLLGYNEEEEKTEGGKPGGKNLLSHNDHTIKHHGHPKDELPLSEQETDENVQKEMEATNLANYEHEGKKYEGGEDQQLVDRGKNENEAETEHRAREIKEEKGHRAREIKEEMEHRAKEQEQEEILSQERAKHEARVRAHTKQARQRHVAEILAHEHIRHKFKRPVTQHQSKRHQILANSEIVGKDHENGKVDKLANYEITGEGNEHVGSGMKPDHVTHFEHEGFEGNKPTLHHLANYEIAERSDDDGSEDNVNNLANYEHEGSAGKKHTINHLANYEHEGKKPQAHNLANYEHEGSEEREPEGSEGRNQEATNLANYEIAGEEQGTEGKEHSLDHLATYELPGDEQETEGKKHQQLDHLASYDLPEDNQPQEEKKQEGTSLLSSEEKGKKQGSHVLPQYYQPKEKENGKKYEVNAFIVEDPPTEGTQQDETDSDSTRIVVTLKHPTAVVQPSLAVKKSRLWSLAQLTLAGPNKPTNALLQEKDKVDCQCNKEDTTAETTDGGNETPQLINVKSKVHEDSSKDDTSSSKEDSSSEEDISSSPNNEIILVHNVVSNKKRVLAQQGDASENDSSSSKQDSPPSDSSKKDTPSTSSSSNQDTLSKENILASNMASIKKHHTVLIKQDDDEDTSTSSKKEPNQDTSSSTKEEVTSTPLNVSSKKDDPTTLIKKEEVTSTTTTLIKKEEESSASPSSKEDTTTLIKKEEESSASPSSKEDSTTLIKKEESFVSPSSKEAGTTTLIKKESSASPSSKKEDTLITTTSKQHDISSSSKKDGSDSQKKGDSNQDTVKEQAENAPVTSVKEIAASQTASSMAPLPSLTHSSGKEN